MSRVHDALRRAEMGGIMPPEEPLEVPDEIVPPSPDLRPPDAGMNGQNWSIAEGAKEGTVRRPRTTMALAAVTNTARNTHRHRDFPKAGSCVPVGVSWPAFHWKTAL